jgi:lipid-A-disaccharide synthase
VLPGSRSSEIRHLLGTFGAAMAQASARSGPMELVLPTVPHLVAQVRAGVSGWAVAPRIVVEPNEKWAAFRQARAALAASGTVTLELALAGIPTVAAYRLSIVEWNIARLLRMRSTLPSVILANLVLGENVIPEFLQSDCTPERLAEALLPLFSDTPQRQRQIAAFGRLDAIMAVGSEAPSDKAAALVLYVAQQRGPRDLAAPAPGSASG